MEKNFIQTIIEPFTQSVTYTGIAYMLLAFPIGLLYFIFSIIGVSLGIGLLIIWIGLPILIIVFAGWYGFVLFEKKMATVLLQVSFHVEEKPEDEEKQPLSTLDRIKSHLSNETTWKGILYLFLKFPLGIFTFSITITLLAIDAALLFAPLLYIVSDKCFIIWNITNMWSAGILTIVGIIVTTASFHILRLLVKLSGFIAELMR